MFHPTRGGTRGGQDQFKWEDVKEDKHRENYLGNSLHAAVGRWQKGRDVTWYAKAGDKDSDLATIQANKKAEMQSIKDAEAEAMAEALGYKTKRKTETNVTDKELKSAISKSVGAAQDDLDQDDTKGSSKVEGLGFKSRAQQRVFNEPQKEADSRTSSKMNFVPVIPLIPETPFTDQGKSKKGINRDEGRDRHDRSRKSRHASRSPSPKREHRRDRSRSRSRSRDKRRRSDGRSSSGRHHNRDDRHRGDRSRSRSRDTSKERWSRDKDSRSSRHVREDDRKHRSRHIREDDSK